MNEPKRVSAITALAAAALSGLIAGAGVPGCASAPKSGASVASTQPGAAVVHHPTEHHLCQGLNSCKGQGGCHTGNNGCKGKNTCKGKGGCFTLFG